VSFSEIGRRLNRHKSTISREVNRNRVRRGSQKYVRWEYFSSQAAQSAKDRRAKSKESVGNVLDERQLLDYVKRGLKNRWSPEQISVRIKKDHAEDLTMRISHQTIYQWLRKDKRNGGKWYLFLRQGKRARRKKYGSSLRRYRIQDQTSIELRPQVVNARNRIGDWEGDTVEGKGHQGRLLTLVDRKSRFTSALKVKSKHSKEVIGAVRRALQAVPSDARRTLTLDNGTEFTYFQDIETRLGTRVYFAHPYSSWERGTNENTNGLLRQYFPKDTDFNKISSQQLASAVIQLNNRPRKCLNWRTPREVFFRL
jgi:IS30 family transposase